MNRKHNDGFTLVELLVTIVVASVVAMAASTVLLLGMRLNSSSSATAQRQNTVRIFLSVVEKMATEGTIGSVTNNPDSWVVKDDGGNELFSYRSGTGTIYTGSTPMMENVIASHIIMEGNLLTLGVETEDGSYTTSVYCRSGAALEDKSVENILNQKGELLEKPEEDTIARGAFLKLLLSQRGSTGMVLIAKEDGTMVKTPIFYAQYYNSAWPIDTAWCGCFLTWALEHDSVKELYKIPDDVPDDVRYLKFANVDTCVEFFVKNGSWEKADFTPAPGDIIFFDWTGNKNNAAHVGAVLAVKDGYIYTIEGNSANMVAVRKYAQNDKAIMGYGIMDWKSDTEIGTE